MFAQGPVFQLVQLAPFPRQLADQPLCLRLQAAVDRRIFVGLKEVVFRGVEDDAEVPDGLVVAALLDQFAQTSLGFAAFAVPLAEKTLSTASSSHRIAANGFAILGRWLGDSPRLWRLGRDRPYAGK